MIGNELKRFIANHPGGVPAPRSVPDPHDPLYIGSVPGLDREAFGERIAGQGFAGSKIIAAQFVLERAERAGRCRDLLPIAFQDLYVPGAGAPRRIPGYSRLALKMGDRLNCEFILNFGIATSTSRKNV